MIGDVAIYDLISDNVSNVYFNKFAQSVKLDEATPKVLIKNLTQIPVNTKEGIVVEECTYRIEIIGTNYINISNTAADIKDLLLAYSDANVYHVIFDNSYYDTDEDVEIHRMIQDYRIHIKQSNGS
jgi:hypothetical protein